MVSLCSKLSASCMQFIAINLWTAPREAYLRMVDALKAVESYLNLVIVRNRFNIMIHRQLATEEVMHAA